MKTETQKQPPAAETNSNGGIMAGKSHDNGGIKFIVQPTGQKIEAEGGEFVITDAALNATDILSMKGTRLQIAQKINEIYGGNTGVVTGVQAGQYVLCNAATQNDEILEVKGTVKEILNQVSESVMCNGVDTRGAAAAVAVTEPVMAQGGIVEDNANYFLNPLFSY